MLVSANKCIGCGMCSISCPQNCIDMQEDDKGFIHPVVNQYRCVSCGLCEQSCSLLYESEKRETIQHLAAKIKNEEERIISSSGGIFISLVKDIISLGGVVCGAAYTKSFTVEHRIVETLEEAKSLCGAKYSQSRFDHCFSEIKECLRNKQWVLFVGTPCQVEALSCNLTALEKEYLISVDFICHGVPSPLVFRHYLHDLSRNHADGSPVSAINMRDKDTGWSKYSYCMKVQFENGQIYQMSSGKDLFLQGFVKNLYLRDSCEDCRYKGINRASDITLGDCWGIWDIAPEFDDNKGTSLVLLHTEKGKAIWGRISHNIEAIVLNETQAFSHNPSALVSSRPHENKRLFWELIGKGKTVVEAVSKSLNNTISKESFLTRLKSKVKRTLLRGD